MPGTAIFDLDKTITRQGTWSRFIRYATGGGFGFWAKLPINGWQALKYKAGFADRASVKTCSISLYFEGQERSVLQAKADAFVARDMANCVARLRGRIAMARKSCAALRNFLKARARLARLCFIQTITQTCHA